MTKLAKLLLTITCLVTLFHAFAILPVSAGIRGMLSTQFGSKCKWEETKSGSGSPLRRIRLICTCKDAYNNDIEYKCWYVSDIRSCCPKLGDVKSSIHYHNYAVAYYAQAVDQIKGILSAVKACITSLGARPSASQLASGMLLPYQALYKPR